MWECQFLELTNSAKKKFIIGNVYRPPGNFNPDIGTELELINKFIDNFSSVLQTNFSTKDKDLAICGDYNTDLLKIHSLKVAERFYEMMCAHSLLPKITQPTRMTTHSATLIDNIFYRFSPTFPSSTAAILTHKLSDHQPCYASFEYGLLKKTSNPRTVTIQKITPETTKNLLSELKELNIAFGPDTEINSNLENYVNELNNCTNKHFPNITRKFRKKQR